MKKFIDCILWACVGWTIMDIIIMIKEAIIH